MDLDTPRHTDCNGLFGPFALVLDPVTPHLLEWIK